MHRYSLLFIIMSNHSKYWNLSIPLNIRPVKYFIIEKWISPKLFSAYRSTYFNTAKRGRKDVSVKSTFYNAELTEKRYPALPFTYNVASKLYLPTLKQDVKDMHWEERVKKGFYLRLPRKKISKRLMALAKRLTYNKHEPMQKAVILRDYLRNN